RPAIQDLARRIEKSATAISPKRIWTRSKRRKTRKPEPGLSLNRGFVYMLNLVFLIGFIFATGSLPPAMAADRVKLALPAKSMGYLPLFIALHRGFFKDEAIDVEIPMMLPQLAHNALMSGEVDYHGAADSALRLAARGAPLKAIFFGAMRPNYFLMAKPQVKSVADL